MGIAVAQAHDRLSEAGGVVRPPGEVREPGRGHLRRDGAGVVASRAALGVAPHVGLDVQDDRVDAGPGGALEERPEVLEVGRHRRLRREVHRRPQPLVGLRVAGRRLQEHVVRELSEEAVRQRVRDVAADESARAAGEALPPAPSFTPPER